jgi:hypothetical protein
MNAIERIEMTIDTFSDQELNSMDQKAAQYARSNRQDPDARAASRDLRCVIQNERAARAEARNGVGTCVAFA